VEPANTNSTEYPGLAASKSLPMAVKLLISDDAAYTVMDVVGP